MIQFFTDFASNEFIYDFKINDIVEALLNLSKKDFARLRLIKREKAKTAMIFVNVVNKIKYDQFHCSIKLQSKSITYLRLHQRYTILDLSNKKLFNQRVESFKIMKKIETLIYKLELSEIMKIHSVILIAQLKFATSDANFYRRIFNNQSSSVTQKNEKNALYEIETLLKKRDESELKYLIKWKNYKNHWNRWYSLWALKNA